MKLNIDKILREANNRQQEGKLEEAENLYRSILKAQPNKAAVHNNLAAILAYQGKLKEAVDSYKMAIEVKPDYVEAYNNLGIVLYEIGRLEEAEVNFRKAIDVKSDFAEAHNNLANMLKELNKTDEAVESYKKAIEAKPDYGDAYYNLGNILRTLNKFDEAIEAYKKAIKLNPDFPELYSSLGATFKTLNRLNDAELNYKKAIELKPSFAEAHNNLGIILSALQKYKEAEACYRKATKFNPDFPEAQNNLNAILKQNKLYLKINQVREFKDEIKVGSLDSNKGLISNPFISNRKVETELLSYLYSINTKELTKTVYADARYGNAICSNFQLFEDNSVAVKKVEKDLTDIMNQAVKSEIYILDSFFNILRAGSGTTPHDHISNFDKVQEITNQKFSLTYYLSTGDQNCSEPGTLKFYEPNEEILPTEGMIAIIPAYRKHSAVYNGKTDRVMIGINFYSLT